MLACIAGQQQQRAFQVVVAAQAAQAGLLGTYVIEEPEKFAVLEHQNQL